MRYYNPASRIDWVTIQCRIEYIQSIIASRQRARELHVSLVQRYLGQRTLHRTLDTSIQSILPQALPYSIFDRCPQYPVEHPEYSMHVQENLSLLPGTAPTSFRALLLASQPRSLFLHTYKTQNTVSSTLSVLGTEYHGVCLRPCL